MRNSTNEEEPPLNVEDTGPAKKKSKMAELAEFMAPKKKEASVFSSQTEVLNQLKKELSIFDATQELPPTHDALKSIPPTTVEAERAFSAAGLFVTKMRCRLGDKIIDELCFLRKYFVNSTTHKK